MTYDVDRVSSIRSAWGFSADPEPWRDSAVCAQVDAEIFFPDKGGSTRDAKRVCWDCPVRKECLDYALRNRERFGIWGGLSERERRSLETTCVVVPGKHGGYRPGVFGHAS